MLHPDGGRMPYGVRDAQAAGSRFDGRQVDRPEVFGAGPGGVLGHEHYLKTLPGGIADGVGDGSLQAVEIPPLDPLPDRTRADEQRGLDCHPAELLRLQDGIDVGAMRATRAVRGDPELLGLDRPGEDDNVSQRRSACAGIADVGSVDPDAGQQSQERLFLLDARLADRRTLQPVAERLVVQHDSLGALERDDLR